MPGMTDIATRAAELREQLHYHIYRYNVLNAPLITDAEYDKLYHELVAIERDHPELRSSDSPTQRVGSDLDTDFAKVPHAGPILSLSNCFSGEDLQKWEERNRRLLPRNINLDYVLEPKLDGLSIVISYIDGVLKTAATRGNGEQGDDVTPNIRTISTVPLRIPANPESKRKAPPRLVVRGEVLFLKEDFERLNQEQEAKGLPRYVNARNTASGSLKQKDSRITAERALNAYIYDIVAIDGLSLKTEMEILEFMQDMGFHVIPHFEYYPSLNAAIEHLGVWEKRRASLPFEIDGVVLKINTLHVREELGIIGKDPRGATAYKFAAEEGTTKLLGVTPNIGRTGKVTPTAQLEPIYIGGVTVSNASLHNYDLIEQLDIRMGDRVIIKRSGDVIPYVIGPVEAARDGSETPITAPVNCPVCDYRLVNPEGAVDLFCPNPKCPERVYRSLEFFVSRGAMDIEGMGPQTIKQLIDAKLITDEADIFYLKAEPISQLEGFADKKITNLIASIEAAKQRSLEQLIASLGIDGVGSVVAYILAKQFRNMDALLNLASKVKAKETAFIALVQPFEALQETVEGRLPDVQKARHRLENPLVQLVPRYLEKTSDLETKLSRLLKPLLAIAPGNAPTVSQIAAELQELIDAVRPLMSIDGLGSVLVRSIVEWFADTFHQALLHKMREAGVNMVAEDRVLAGNNLEGKVFVITGAMSVPREQIEALIENYGGKVTGSVSKKTDYVVVGENAGSKATKAAELGVKILSEEELRTLVAG
jgi:DNA ligase (NAD+)